MTSLGFCFSNVLFYNFTFTIDQFNLTISCFDGHNFSIDAIFLFLFVPLSKPLKETSPFKKFSPASECHDDVDDSFEQSEWPYVLVRHSPNWSKRTIVG